MKTTQWYIIAAIIIVQAMTLLQFMDKADKNRGDAIYWHARWEHDYKLNINAQAPPTPFEMR